MARTLSGRLSELDALRGLAACTVVLDHFAAAYDDESNYDHESTGIHLVRFIAHIFTGGHQAILLFFILSGLVLALPSIKGKTQTYRVFMTRRIFRIYVPYIAAIFWSVLGNLRWYGPLGMTAWADRTWGQRVHARAVLQHILFIGQFDYVRFNTAIWTLCIEMRVSIVFPLLCFVVLRARPWISLAAAGAMTVLIGYMQIRSNGGIFTGMTEVIMNLYFAAYFVVGILLARYLNELTGWASGLSKRNAVFCLAAALALYFYGSWTFGLVGKTFFKLPHPNLLAFDSITGIGGALTIIMALSYSPFSKFLVSSVPQFLGKISYSMYLIHSVVLFALLHMLHGVVPPVALFFVYVPLVLVAATIMYRLVEKPAMELGRRITSRAPSALQPVS